MCCGIIDAVGEFFKTAVACVCFLLIGGPILLIVGSIFLKQPNNRALYNEAVKAFDSKPIESWTGNINNFPVSIRRESLKPNGVDPAVSVFVQAAVPLPRPDLPSSYGVSVHVSNVKPFERSTAAYQKRTESIQCSSTSSLCMNQVAEFQAKCKSSGGQDEARTCSPGFDHCRDCVRYRFLSGMYLVVTETSPGQYAKDPTMESALYDFGNFANIYSDEWPPTVDVRLYSSKDPRIALERYTQGSGDFGINPRTAGIAMVVVGSILVLIEIFACTAVIYYFCIRRKSTDAGAAGNAVPAASGLYSAYPPGNPPSNYYGQQYQNQPPGTGYGQPPPVQGYEYGQPPPAQGYGYGQPPPAQGYGYGQPPQGQGYGYGKPPQGQGYGYGQPPQAQGNEYKPGPI